MPRPSDTTRMFAGAYGGVTVICWLVLKLLGLDGAPAPFAWSDVALVALLSTLPVAALAAALVRGLVSPLVGLILAAGAAVLEVMLLRLAAPPAVPAAAFGFALLLAMLSAQPAFVRAPQPWTAWILALACAAVVPPLYVAAHLRSDRTRLLDLARQLRWGEAQILARRMHVVAPAMQIEGLPIGQIIAQNQRVLDELAEAVAAPLAQTANDGARLLRARDLAMLGRTGEALAVLASSPSLSRATPGRLLRGAIYIARREYAPALAEYVAARQALSSAPQADADPPVLVEATRQVAWCQRLLGRYAEAEQTYGELLALSPTATTHFELAEFYALAQQASRARSHARQAAQLDPDQFGGKSEQLIDRLVTHQFGCWSVFSAER